MVSDTGVGSGALLSSASGSSEGLFRFKGVLETRC